MLTFTLTIYKPEGRQESTVQAPTDDIMWQRACNLFHHNKEAYCITFTEEDKDRVVIRIMTRERMLFKYVRSN